MEKREQNKNKNKADQEMRKKKHDRKSKNLRETIAEHDKKRVLSSRETSEKKTKLTRKKSK